VHTAGGTCAHGLPVFCLPAFVHCINIQKLSFLPGLKNCKAEYSTNAGFVTFVCWNFYHSYCMMTVGVNQCVRPILGRLSAIEGVSKINFLDADDADDADFFLIIIPYSIGDNLSALSASSVSEE